MTDYNSEDFWKGAPEGATHYLPADAKRSWVACWYKQNSLGQWLGFNAENYYRGIRDEWTVDNDQVEAFTAALIQRSSCAKPAPWSGDGLPPVGTVCEFKEHARDSWAECTIIGEFRGRIICGCNQTGAVGYIDLGELRPIKTAAQIATEKREAAINELTAGFSNDTLRSWAIRAYDDLGYRKGDEK